MMKLALRFQKCPMELFVPEALRSKFDGTFGAEAQITLPLEDKARPQVKGRLHFANAMLHGLPALNRVAEFTGNDRFRRLKFNELQGDFSWDGTRLEATDFELESAGLMRIEGRFTTKEGSIQARMRLGVSAAVLSSFPGAREDVFTEKKRSVFLDAASSLRELEKARR